ncbi:exocyst complex component Sec10-like protein [Gautieria morchelliformis]|nr:exocyst complex component Sec10-like protein [Gautieria morchelliformis]
MDKWTTLEPTRLYASATTGLRSRTVTKPDPSTYIGRLPKDLHVLIITYLPVYQIPAYSRGNRALSKLTRDERVWEAKWNALLGEQEGLADVLDNLEVLARGKTAEARARAPPTLPVDADDEFGDFASVSMGPAQPGEMGDFVGSFNVTLAPRTPLPTKPTFRSKYIRAHNLLKSLLPSLDSSPHLILSNLFPSPLSTLRHQSQTLHLLRLYLSPSVQPLRNWPALRSSLRSAIDRFEASLLAAFERADGLKDEDGMKEAAWSSWEVWDRAQRGEWEIGRVWAEKREVFYEGERWDPLKNFTKDDALDFDAMVEFMTYELNVIREHGSTAVRVFPPAANVLTMFAGRISVEVVAEYILPLLNRAREISNEIFLRATAASFAQAWRMVDVMVSVGGENITKTQAEDVVYQMFEQNMDEYLDEEVESVKATLETICRGWERQLASQSQVTAANQSARFLDSHNPALMKRNVLASFTNVLLLPVTIVPRTVGAFVTTSSTAAVNGIAMLNPQRWGAQAANGYSADLTGKNGDFYLDNTDVEEHEREHEKRPSSISSRATLDPPSSTAGTSASSRSASPKPSPAAFDRLQMLLSLDVALELIHADRESLKRVETFQYYPGHYGHKVRETVEELFILMLQALSDRHITPGFRRATEQMHTYKPAEHEETTSVAPLMQFFELVHIGDTIQSMAQVYFDKEMAPHIDRTDFLNGVVREKKRFENALDDCVAAGLNAGTEVLMNQVEHIIWTRTGAREYYPQEGDTLELGPTQGCREAIACLEMHCKLIRGSTSKDVLEVFYEEVGIRLHAVIQKHLKRQIISLDGGFQVIADLNAYHTFISSLKVPQITNDFANLKMLGHVFIVSDAKDLAQIVRDVTRYGGSFRPEDIYEFIQRRSDWKKIEKTVDKTMYNLSFKEDCVIC